MKTDQLAKRLLCFVLSTVLVLGLLPLHVLTAFAEEYPDLSLNTPTAVTVSGSPQVFRVIPATDSWYQISSQLQSGDPNVTLYDSNWNKISSNDDSNQTMNFTLKAKLLAGDTYYYSCGSYKNKDSKYTVTLTEARYAKTVAMVTPPYTSYVVEGYASLNWEGMELEFTLSDGSKESWTWQSTSKKIAGSKVTVTSHLEEDATPPRYYISISCDDAYYEYDYIVVENTVKQIEYTGDNFLFYENTHGHISGHYVYDYQMTSDHTVIVHFKDGTKEYGYVGGTVRGVPINWYDKQKTSPWKVNANNTIVLSYLGVSTTIPVTISPIPYTAAQMNLVPRRVYYWGDEEYGQMINKEYSFYPEDLTGLAFTVTLKDGTKQTFTEADIDMEKGEINGYPYQIKVITAKGTGTVQATLQYKGITVQYPVMLKESPVAGIEIKKDAQRLDYDISFYPFLDGMEMKVQFTDGSTTTVTLSEDNVRYLIDDGDLRYTFDVNGYTVYVDPAYNELYGEYYIFSCLGARYNYTKFAIDDIYPVHKLQQYRIMDDETLRLKLQMEDGSTRFLDLTLIDVEETAQDSFVGYVTTEWGIGYFTLKRWEQDATFHFYDTDLQLDLYGQLGDVTDDGRLNATDALNVLKMVVGNKTATVRDELRGDVDGDFKISAVDALEILKYVVGKPSVLG